VGTVEINLGLIPVLFPRLSTLFLRGIDLRGTLESVSELRCLDLGTIFGWDSRFLPTMSRNTLTSFRICDELASDVDEEIFQPALGFHHFPALGFHHFRALRHVHFEPLCPAVIEFLHATECSLLSFATKLGWTNIHVDIPLLAHAFTAPSLQTLEKLLLKLNYWDAIVPEMYPPEYEDQAPVIAAITSNLKRLQTIILWLPVDINWSSQFKSLDHLEYVEWAVLPSFIYEKHSLEELTEAFTSSCNQSTNSSPTFVFEDFWRAEF
jgi:hypothetical protein